MTNWPLRISQDGRYPTENDGTPYFPIADTVWMLSYVDQDDISLYMAERPKKGFNAVFVSLIGVENLKHYIESGAIPGSIDKLRGW